MNTKIYSNIALHITSILIIVTGNILVLHHYIVPVLSDNIDHGYIDAFNLIMALFGQTPGKGMLSDLVINTNEQEIRPMFIIYPIILVTWLGSLPLFKLVFWDIPYGLLSRVPGIFSAAK
ncbi:hypothetical protein [Yersinia enterocolitica]|uniref:hypothetical protein n=1 Tax=Yersinia enterocolitica TaxID=630 RepID=UPI003D033576